MRETPIIGAEVTFLPTNEGGRQQSIYFEANHSSYRPHLVVGDPMQRRPIVLDGNVCAEEYLGIAFHAGPDVVNPGDTCAVRMSLIYHPDVDYSAVVPGVTFTLREGGTIVGFGRVTERSMAK